MQPQKDSKETWLFALQIAGAFFFTFIVLLVFGFVPQALKPDMSNIAYQDTINEQYTYEQESIEPNIPTQNVQYVRAYEAEGTYGLSYEDDEIQEITRADTKPAFIEIDKIGVSSQILHPSSPRVDVLDEALKRGAVYYPGSGTIEQGNIFLFGHSSNWAIVQNQAYKTFNNLEDLVPGDEITLRADGKTYIYSVQTVNLVDANTAFVDLSRSGRRLTISTCNTFGQKSERWVVDAVFKEVRG